MKRQMTEEREKELQELQEYFINSSRENAVKLLRLQALLLLSRSEEARSLTEIRDEAGAILNVIRGI